MKRLIDAMTLSLASTFTLVSPALATTVPEFPVPEPTTLSLLSGGLALAVLGARWFRRK